MSPKFLFLQQFIRHPRMVGSVIPTSDIAIHALLDPVDWQDVRCVVEYGPGTGVFTRRILERLGPDARLIAIDTNPMFVTHLRQHMADPRLICVEGSAADVEAILAREGFEAADYIISGLPFSTLPPAVADDIAAATARAIRPGGQFLVYQYSRFVLSRLEANFANVAQGMVWRCIPPARLFWARKGNEAGAALSDAESLAVA
ncbi:MULTISPECIES: class I SAM-dependent methyltransferase [unclassified Sphingobium]|uniref:class I SAM-dependent methyltransferase n=1 Tax=unclassified Sphingobium TaxID=2611147 RepID=UPI0015ECA46E|nr:MULTISPECIES: methyltransferase domain-containing protein [unclassified Sphingobium]MCW2361708.1 phospholipid N-methyltransferase [Sphingobium sp. B10D3B]MCW2401613.1 phospholipid N-methyltransferase [Sphingobium sp. B10D7B]MCW2408593.1 phospholipid N-methyltransferase [Sphingobium xanthum]